MIQKVSIENFQSHRKSELEFAPGVNVIIGASDAGKSAIFNAINWLATNRPLGESFRSEWGGDTIVQVELDDGEIERIRTKTKNAYHLNGEPLQAFGTEVPTEVLDLLGMDDQSIQAQMDAPFLLSLSSGEAAKMLNRAAAIDEIDSGISALRKSLNSLNNSVSYDQNEIDKYNRVIGQYQNLDSLEKLINAVEVKVQEKEVVNHRADRLRAVYGQILGVNSALERFSYQFDQIMPVFDLCQQKNAELVETTRKISQLEHAIEKSKTILEKMTVAYDMKLVLQKVNTVAEQDTELAGLHDQQKRLKHLIGAVRNKFQNIKRLEEVIQKTEKEYAERMPETCPLCGATV